MIFSWDSYNLETKPFIIKIKMKCMPLFTFIGLNFSFLLYTFLFWQVMHFVGVTNYHDTRYNLATVHISWYYNGSPIIITVPYMEPWYYCLYRGSTVPWFCKGVGVVECALHCFLVEPMFNNRKQNLYGNLV